MPVKAYFKSFNQNSDKSEGKMESKIQHSQEDISFLGLELSSDISNQLIKIAKNARNSSYSPYSDFKVGCGVLLENNVILPGNV